MKSNHHVPYTLGDTRYTMVTNNEMQASDS